MYAKMYRNAIDTAKRELFRKVTVVPGKPDLHVSHNNFSCSM